ncbi:hypothetical protein [Leifsonia sp. WHRI 6310E]|uniref:hypothetical protein n=1 Tax=Leifsonia sp. WHRI 6310E TaxID=3162562 RepID=UPI0032EDCBCA
MIQPATSGIAIPDDHGAKARGWLIAYYVTGSLFVAAAFANLIVYVASFSTRAFGAVLLCAGLMLLFGILSLICALTWSSYNASTRRELADALARAGHHGVDAKRLLQTKRPLVASPAACSCSCAANATTTGGSGSSSTPSRRPASRPHSCSRDHRLLSVHARGVHPGMPCQREFTSPTEASRIIGDRPEFLRLGSSAALTGARRPWAGAAMTRHGRLTKKAALASRVGLTSAA